MKNFKTPASSIESARQNLKKIELVLQQCRQNRSGIKLSDAAQVDQLILNTL